MASIADLLKQKPRLAGNLFAADTYFQSDIELGMLKNRQGSRLLALPSALVDVLYSGLEYELGASTGYVLYQCGYHWGKAFYRRFVTEVSEYYGQPVAQMGTLEFVQALQQCWKTSGWGQLEMNFDAHQQGFLGVSVQNSAFTKSREGHDKPQAEIEAGFLSAFFSQLTGQPLECVQSACEALGAPANQFILGLKDRLKPAEAWLEEGLDHATILDRLCHPQAAIDRAAAYQKPATEADADASALFMAAH
jgi:uncharacterized protein